MSFLFNPQTCFGPVGCKPTASYLLLSTPTCVLALLVANLQPHIVFVQSSHLFRPRWLQTYSLISFLFNPRTLVWVLLVVNLQPHVIFVQSSHTCLGLAGCKPTASYHFFSILALVLVLLVANLQPHIIFVQSSHLFWSCWLQTYSLISFFFNPRTCLSPVGCKPTASCHLCSIPTLVLALLVANIQPHINFLQSSHLFRPCWLQTYSLISLVFNPRTCLGPVGCKPTASYHFCSILAHLFGSCWL